MKNFNTAPYYDDYDALKGYIKLLFNPGNAVQSRELTTMQSTLQNQIANLGDYIFDEGSEVLGGQAKLDLDYKYVKISSIGADVVYGDITATQISKWLSSRNAILTGATSGMRATLVNFVDVEDSDPITAFVKYTNSGTDGQTKAFTQAEEITVKIYSDEEYAKEVVTVGSGTADATFTLRVLDVPTCTGSGSALTITKGTRFVAGYFIAVDEQTIILDKYSNTPTADVGLRIVEDIITPEDDASLLDIAQGYPNYAAPGADRYKVRLLLSLRGEDSANFVRILSVKDGQVLVDLREAQLKKPGLEKELAKRMYDTNGNFTVEEFKVEVREHLNDGAGNRGMFTAEEGGDETKLVLDVDSGRAYVQGYEVATTGSEFVVFDKARNTFTYNNAVIGATYDAYCIVDTLVNDMPSISDYSTVTLKDGLAATVGTARIRNMEIHDIVTTSPTDDTITTSATWKLYLFDIQMSAGKVFDDAETIHGTGVNSTAWSANITGTDNRLYGRTNSVTAEQLPFSVVKQITDMTYNVRRQKVINGSTPDPLVSATAGTITINAPTNETFEPNVDENYTLWNETRNEFIKCDDIDFSSDFKTITINFDIGILTTTDAFNLIYTVNKNNADSARKSKVLMKDQVVTPSVAPSQTEFSLGKADVVRIKSIKIGTSTGTDVTEKFVLDNGQRDGYYDTASVSSVAGYSVPVGNLYITFDYFQHVSSGDYFTAQSYDPDDFELIPTFTSSFGEVINLRDAVDFRPLLSSTSYGDLFIPNGAIRGDIEYHLSRIDKVVVDESGKFSVIKGAPALNPTAPPTPNTGMTILELSIPAYTFSPKDVKVEYVQNKRYTMRDIGKLEKRIETLEYYTSLNLLEQSTNDKVFKDSLGETRFKNGFLVDAFSGHSVGDVANVDYQCSIDAAEGELRPEANAEFIELLFDSANSTDYKIEHRTGLVSPIATLPYTEVLLVDQKLASSTMNVNPYAIFTWEGELKLTPSTDMWIDTKRLPNVVVNREGELDNIVDDITRSAQAAYRTWFSWWNNNWFGVGGDVSSVFTSANDSGGRPQISSTEQVVGSFKEINRARPHNTGQVRTHTVKRTITQIVDDRIIDITAVPFMRSKNIQFSLQRMRPNTKLYASFDGIDVTSYCTPEIRTDSSGKYDGTFSIPDPNDGDPLTPQFRTGKRKLLISDDQQQRLGEYTTFAEAIYEANGAIETKQATITSVAGPTRTTSTSWYDPLAQSFLIDNEVGCFITGVEVFFASKDANIPVTLEIRNMVNGYPGQVVAPFSKVTIDAADVQVSDDASIGTYFQFEAPVYLHPNEYCFMISAMSTKYNVWVAEMGKVDILSQEAIAKQPFAGVLFKSQNASTWTADQTADMKFKINRASFDTTKTPVIQMYNDEIPLTLLGDSPIYTTEDSEVIRVKCESHGFAVGSYVELVSASTVNGLALSTTDSNGDDVAGIWQVIAPIEQDYYTAMPVAGQTGIGNSSGATETSWAGNDADGNPAVYATKNYGMDLMKLTVQQMAVVGGDGDGNAKTGISWQIRATEGKSIDSESQQVQYRVDSGFIDTDTNGNFLFDEPKVITSKYNEDNQTLMNGKHSAIVKATMFSINEFVSPVINMARAGIVAVSNRTSYPEDISDELLPAILNPTTAASTRYITRAISLNDPAEEVKVIFDANRPSSAEIRVYIKKLGADVDEKFNVQDWEEIDREVYPKPNSNRDEFSEYIFSKDFGLAGQFNMYAIKIVMLSRDSSSPPRVRDFRTIALT